MGDTRPDDSFTIGELLNALRERFQFMCVRSLTSLTDADFLLARASLLN